jgi:hypothetical protein
MRKYTLLIVLLSVYWIAAGETRDNSIDVSPGSETGLTPVTQSYPTFSWSAFEPESVPKPANGLGNGIAGATNTFHGQMDGGTEGAINTFYGLNAGLNITSGTADTFIGLSAGYSNTTGGWNTFIGQYAGFYNTTGQGNVFLGDSAGVCNITGSSNAFLGSSAGFHNNTGGYNTFVGTNAGYYNTTGASNTFLGTAAGVNNTLGNNNAFFGYASGNSNTTGGYNTFIGDHAGWSNATGYSNIFLGSYAGYNETGSNTLYIHNSGSSDPLIYGEFGNHIVNINGKLGIGTKTPGYPMEIVRTGANASIVVNRTDGAKNYMNATTSFGNFGTVNNYPLRLVVNSLGKMTLNSDNSLSMASGATCTAGGVWTNASSIALKENISALGSDEAATTLQALNPVKYNYKAEKDENHVGFIAEEAPELVAMKDRKSLSPMDIVAVLTKVTQDQQKQLQDQQKLTQKQQQQLQDQQQLIQLQQQTTQKQQQQLQDQQQNNDKMKMEIAELQQKLSK